MKDLNAITLQKGSHTTVDDGMCAMEAVAWLVDEPHSDHPICTCPVLAAYVRALNDRMPDDFRHRLKEYIPRLIGTRNDTLELERMRCLAWAVLTKILPMAFTAVGLIEHAEKLRNLVPNDWLAAHAAADAAASAAHDATAAAYAADAADAATLAAAYADTDAVYTASRTAHAAAYAARAITNGDEGWELTLSALSDAIEIT